MNFGLSDSDMNKIINVLKSFKEVEIAIIFGSRSKGSFKAGSDVDIALKGEKITYETVLRLNSILNEETPLPYFFDVVNYHTIANTELTQHIDRAGKTIFSRYSS